MARVIRHPLSPKVVGENVSEARTGPDVRVVSDSPHIVVHELPVKRVAVAQRTERDQHSIATHSSHRSELDR